MPRFFLIFGVLVVIFVGLLVFSGYLGSKTKIPLVPQVPVGTASPSDEGAAFFSNPTSSPSASLEVTSTTPANGTDGVLLNSPVIFNFNQSFDSSASAILFSPDVQFTQTGDAQNVVAIPNPQFEPDTNYRVTVNVPSSNFSYSLNFTTVSASASASPAQ